MSDKILVTYVTNAGSTAEVAKAIGEELGKSGAEVDVRPFQEVAGLDSYGAIVVGAPMIIGWHRKAMAFLAEHQEALSRVPVAYFVTCLELTLTGEESIGGVPIYRDPKLGEKPKVEGKYNFKERFALPSSYLEPMLERAPQAKPVSVGVFKGKLDYGKLNILQNLFVRFIIRGKAGDYRNWDAIREWAASLNTLLAPSQEP